MLDGVQTKTCYCAIGAGGKPCVDRAYCDEHRDRKFAERVAAVRKPDEYGNDGRCRCNCRTAKESFVAGYLACMANEYPHNNYTEAGLLDEAEGEYREWKRRQAKTD